MGINHRIALVTGGTGGIGTSICQALAASGARVVCGYHDHHEVSAHKWLAQQQQLGYMFTLQSVDVGDYASCERGVKQIIENMGTISILINNAGITQDAVLRKMQVEQWQQVLRVNLDSVFNLSQNVLAHMIEQQYGRIINISSVNGQKGQFGQCNYAAAKAGMHGFTKSLAQEVARKGITVNTVSPGYVATDMVKGVDSDILQKIVAQIPVGRLAEPKEIADMVAFLADDNSSYITGADFSINGGLHMY